MAKVKNTVIEKYDDGRAAILDLKGVVREVPDCDYEIGQCVFVDVEAIDMASAIMSKEGTKRAMAGDFNIYEPSIKTGLKRVVVRHVFPIAASFALALIFGVGGGVYASGEVKKTVETDGVTYDMNYFDRVIGVHIDEVEDEDLSELRREIHGKTLDDAQSVIDEKKRKDELEVPQVKEPDTDLPPDEPEKNTQKEDEEQGSTPEEITVPEPEGDFGVPRDDMENPPGAMEDEAAPEPEKGDRMKQPQRTQDEPSDALRQQPDKEGDKTNRPPEEKPDEQKDMQDNRKNETSNERQSDMPADRQTQEGVDENDPRRDITGDSRPQESEAPQNERPSVSETPPER